MSALPPNATDREKLGAVLNAVERVTLAWEADAERWRRFADHTDDDAHRRDCHLREEGLLACVRSLRDEIGSLKL